MSAKLARQLLAQKKTNEAVEISPKGPPRKRTDSNKNPLEDSTLGCQSREKRSRTGDSDDLKKYCHSKSPSQISNSNKENDETLLNEDAIQFIERCQEVDRNIEDPPQRPPSPEVLLRLDAEEFIERCSKIDMQSGIRPPSPPSPETLLRPGAKEFIDWCNNEQNIEQGEMDPTPKKTEQNMNNAEQEDAKSSQDSFSNLLPPPPNEKSDKLELQDDSSTLPKQDASLPKQTEGENDTSDKSKKCSACQEACKQPPFKGGLCIDHYLTQKKTIDHKFLNADGKTRLNIDQQCDKVNKKFLADKSYETTPAQMNDLKTRFMEMDEDGSGDIDVIELGRAMEKLGKPKNQLQLRKMIAEVDVSGSGTIEYEEFVLMMIGTSSSVLRLILLFEKKAKGEEPPPKGKKKPMINLYA